MLAWIGSQLTADKMIGMADYTMRTCAHNMQDELFAPQPTSNVKAYDCPPAGVKVVRGDEKDGCRDPVLSSVLVRGGGGGHQMPIIDDHHAAHAQTGVERLRGGGGGGGA